MGSGIRNLYRYTQIYSGGEPELVEGDIFKTIIPLKMESNGQHVDVRGEDSGGVSASGEDSGGVSGEVSGGVKLKQEKLDALLEYCIKPKGRKEMQEFCGLKSDDYFRAKVIKPLLKLGLVEMTIPDKPNSRNQKYIKV